MNSFLKLVVFIIAVALCVFISKSLTPPTPQELVNSVTYINKALKDITDEKNGLIERTKLGLEDSAKIKLFDYKYRKINSFLYGGYKLSVPCDEYCDYLNNKESGYQFYDDSSKYSEETKACNKEYYLSANQLLNTAQTANVAYMNKESISKDEFQNIIKEVKMKNKEIIEEVDKILNLTSIPETKTCTDEICKNLNKGSNKNQETKTEFSQDETNKIMDDYSQRTAFIANEIYKELNVSIKCYKLWHRLGGEDLDKQTECSYAELKKIDKYCNEHQDDYVCFVPD